MEYKTTTNEHLLYSTRSSGCQSGTYLEPYRMNLLYSTRSSGCLSGTYLAHYQIKGAKHGVRRFQNPDGSLTPLGRIRYGVGSKRRSRGARRVTKSNTGKKQGSSKSVKEMSDQELTAAINRLRNEQTYAQLMSDQNVSIGKRIVREIIAPVTKDIAKDTYRDYAKQAIKSTVVPAIAYAGKKVIDKIVKKG